MLLLIFIKCLLIHLCPFPVHFLIHLQKGYASLCVKKYIAILLVVYSAKTRIF